MKHRPSRQELIDRMLKRSTVTEAAASPAPAPQPQLSFIRALREPSADGTIEAAWVEVALGSHELTRHRITVYDTLCTR